MDRITKKGSMSASSDDARKEAADGHMGVNGMVRVLNHEEAISKSAVETR